MSALRSCAAAVALLAAAPAAALPSPPPPPVVAPDPLLLAVYDHERKSPAGAVVAELIIEGAGSLYVHDWVGAGITWTSTIGGIALIVHGNDQKDRPGEHGPSDSTVLVAAGAGLLLAGRVFGLVNAYVAASDYNRRLRARLSVPASLSLGVAPVHTVGGVAAAPGLRLTF